MDTGKAQQETEGQEIMLLRMKRTHPAAGMAGETATVEDGLLQ